MQWHAAGGQMADINLMDESRSGICWDRLITTEPDTGMADEEAEAGST